jgi:co-chaperonin GroES (HSP10)
MFASVSSDSIRKSCFKRKLLRNWLVFFRDWRLQRVNLKRPLNIASILRGKTMLKGFAVFRSATLRVSVILLALGFSAYGAVLMAQAPAAVPAPAARQLGTVTAIAGNSLTLKTDAGQEVVVSVPDGTRILQLAPGSTDLKTAQTIALKDIEVGDRVLVSGKAGDSAGTFAAARVILMKSSDIAQKHETEQADWQKRGTGGIVSAVDAGTGTLTVTVGAKKVAVTTSGKTQFRRYAGDSVKFEDAKPGTLAQIQVGDQLRVLGTKSDDGSSIPAEVVVSGSFKNLAGLIATIDAANGTLTLKDLATKKTVTVAITANSNVRTLPPQAAAMFAARAKGAGAGASGGGSPQPAGQAEASGGGRPGGAGRSAGGDLSQLVSRLPNKTIADLKVGDAVMIVASQSDPGSGKVTAVTLLSGVEPILAATPSGGPAMTLSPWNLGGEGTPEGGGGH